MRGTSSPGVPQGLTQSTTTPNGDLANKSANISMAMASKAMKLKLSGKVSAPREVSPRKQVGDAEAMFVEGEGGKGAWWRNVGMEEGM
jgi:hypothetical protein